MNYAEMIVKHAQNHNITNIVIAGMTCSGKTTLSHQIKDYLAGQETVTIISQDDYFKDLCDIPRSPGGYLTDSIDAFKTREYQDDVTKLLKQGKVLVPVYDVAINRRTGYQRVCKATYNVFEGLHAIEILENIDQCITIFVDTDPGICLERRIKRDSTKYGVPRKRIIEYWEECIYPMSVKYIFPQRGKANLCIKTQV